VHKKDLFDRQLNLRTQILQTFLIHTGKFPVGNLLVKKDFTRAFNLSIKSINLIHQFSGYTDLEE